MLRASALILCFLGTTLFADADISFTLGGKTYNLNGGQAVVTKKNGKLQLLIGARDPIAKAQFAITAEIPQNALSTTQELSAEFSLLSAVVVNDKGIYTVAPHQTLARDDFIRYTARDEIQTDELEEDPFDRPETRIDECQGGLTELCQRLMHKRRHKRKKIRVSYRQHGPTWVGKTREQRLASGDGVVKEDKYKDVTFVIRLTPKLINGKLVELSGNFGGVLVFNEGMKRAVNTPISAGLFRVQVKNVP